MEKLYSNYINEGKGYDYPFSAPAASTPYTPQGRGHYK